MNQTPPPQTQQQPPRPYRVFTMLTQEEMDMLRSLMMVTQMNEPTMLLRALHNFLYMHDRAKEGYTVKFINKDGEEYEPPRIVLGGNKP